MTQHDPEAWLDLARQGLAPREADQARVLSALEQRLDLPLNEASSAHRQELNSVPSASPSLGMGAPGMLVRWALGAIVPLAGVAAVGVFLTTRNVTPQAPVLKPATHVAAAVITPELDLSIAQVQVKEISQPKAPEPASPAPKEKKPQRSKKCRTAQGSERPCATTRTTESAIASAPPPESSLSQELAALREAQRALREGRPADALSVLTSFEQAAAGRGAMQEERAAAATMARCALQKTKQLYDEFMQRYPKSAYAARLARTCLPKPAR
jgi:hypothetical protein